MELKVKDVIKELEKYNPEAKIITVTVGKNNEWDYTSNPKINTSKNIFGEVVWIL